MLKCRRTTGILHQQTHKGRYWFSPKLSLSPHYHPDFLGAPSKYTSNRPLAEKRQIFTSDIYRRFEQTATRPIAARPTRNSHPHCDSQRNGVHWVAKLSRPGPMRMSAVFPGICWQRLHSCTRRVRPPSSNAYRRKPGQTPLNLYVVARGLPIPEMTTTTTRKTCLCLCFLAYKWQSVWLRTVA